MSSAGWLQSYRNPWKREGQTANQMGRNIPEYFSNLVSLIGLLNTTFPHHLFSSPALHLYLLSFQISIWPVVPSVHLDSHLTSHRYAAMGLFSSRKTDTGDTVTAVIAPASATGMDGGAVEKSVVNVLRSRFVRRLNSCFSFPLNEHSAWSPRSFPPTYMRYFMFTLSELFILVREKG
jgi:hypothetical protein